jgi:hypothetical protein
MGDGGRRKRTGDRNYRVQKAGFRVQELPTKLSCPRKRGSMVSATTTAVHERVMPAKAGIHVRSGELDSR